MVAAFCKRFVLMSVEGLRPSPSPERVPLFGAFVRWWPVRVLLSWVHPFLKIKVSVPGRTMPRKASVAAKDFAFTFEKYEPLCQVSTPL